MIYNDIPDGFNPVFDVVSCFAEYNKKILLLLRQDHKPEGNKWGVPAGKVNKGEDILEAMVREFREETIVPVHPERFKYLRKIFVRQEKDFIYHEFLLQLERMPNIIVNQNEHKDFTFVLPAEALKMNLIEDEEACIRLAYSLQKT